MNIFTRPLVAAATCCAVGGLLTSCFDDNYDLSDIDKTIRVDVNNLVVPINLDSIYLSSIIDIEPGDRLQVVDGQYAVIENGRFNSSDIVINRVHLNAPSIAPTVNTISAAGLAGVAPKAESMSLSYELYSQPTEFEYVGNGNEYVTAIERVYGDITIAAELQFEGFGSLVKSITINNLELQMPKGLTLSCDKGGQYDPETGVLRYSTLRTNAVRETITLHITELDFAAMGGEYADMKASIKGQMQVLGGQLVISTDDISTSADLSNLPREITMRGSYTMSAIDISLFTGSIRYDITGVNINDVDLSDLPDVLSQEGTVVKIANPQLYLQANNPLHDYNIVATTGLKITSYPRYDGGVTRESQLDNGTFNVTGSGSVEIANFCLSPKAPAAPYEGFANAEHVPFTSLSDVLDCGNGLPSRLGVDLVDPRVPSQRVERFRLGVDLGSVNGKYTFLAPLQFGAGSKITYTDVLDGWASDDLADIMITALEVNLTLNSDLPLGAVLTGYPIDRHGNQIGGVQVEGATVEANANNQQLKLHITGQVNGAILDGLRFEAVVSAAESDQPLSPDMGLHVTNIRPCVSGYYQTEL